MNYYLADNGQQRGPFPPEQMVGQGMKADSLVWAEGMPQWQRADEVAELRPALGLVGGGTVAGEAAPVAAPAPVYAAPYAAPPQGYASQPPGYAPQGYPSQGYAPPGYAMPLQPVGYAGGFTPPSYSGGYDPNVYRDANGKKLASGLCGILLGLSGLGGFGIHKFVLGLNTAGVVYLLVSIVGGIVTCGVSTLIMSLIAVIEGIIYLTKSDEQFYVDYIVNKKQWF